MVEGRSDGVAFARGEAVRDGVAAGPPRSSESRAGACTARGGRAEGVRAGVDGPADTEPRPAVRSTPVHPERASTATAADTRSTEVVVDRCTRATLLPPACPGATNEPACPARVTPAHAIARFVSS
ncbi:hypothetical protein GCM10010349_72710 [Streptomyces flavofungini]|nr:hypothetical protein GCM10010349_72710 [Streptomyces flavofungini]